MADFKFLKAVQVCAPNNLLCIIQKTVFPRKPEEDVKIKFRKSWEGFCE